MSREILEYLQRIEMKMDQKFEQMGKRFEQMEVKFEKKFEQMDKRLESIEKRLDSVEKRLDSQENMLAQLIEMVTVTNQPLDYFEKETHKRFDTIELKLNRLEADVNLLFQENADQKREINYIKQKVV